MRIALAANNSATLRHDQHLACGDISDTLPQFDCG